MQGIDPHNWIWVTEIVSPPEAATVAGEMESRMGEVDEIRRTFNLFLTSISRCWRGQSYNRYLEMYAGIHLQLEQLEQGIRLQAETIRKIKVTRRVRRRSIVPGI